MRFKKGDKVEVMNNKEVPVSWRSAEIISGSGHTYTVQYDYYPGMATNRMVEMVSSKFVRPCPPLVHGVQSFMAGDIVDVFYECSWKIAAILKILAGKKETKWNKNHMQVAGFENQYLVRLLGCSRELVIDRSNIRIRQTWHDNKWILMGKNSGAGDDVIANKPSTSNCCPNTNFQVAEFNARAKNLPKKDCTNNQDDAALWGSAVISSRSLKRMSPYGSSVVETHNGRVQKLRAIEKDGWKQRVVAAPVLEKGYSWRHASFASNGLHMMPGCAAFLLALNFGRFTRLLSKRCYSLWLLPANVETGSLAAKVYV
ncbi:hypothetical protein CDL12_08915 [Handroanthus impetiginosus]|uniref:Agenet domain-containing protein n=1 Tax=Handroanthus impetiginosus TaxID=429701 RepID=A0A2G9HLM1_9LAMI|nr:hypothetical protein CDL12_08915 [Handroanthus impetiginosus]